ncbi:hypothetical protein QE152_g24988 [Popillia japonica]|uniref:Reverse transcriptase n=1 Tax=Popillia japonica TaxID=7064 RepID=A0AAW1K4V2_POPJA
MWCDSTIVLDWLKITPNRLKTFVSNRVAEVQELSAQFTWRHVPSAENPADCLSRGLMPGCIKDAQLWWNGPEWLKQEERFWPTKINSGSIKDQDLPDTKKDITTLHVQQAERFPVERFSKLHTLKRVVAWIIRFKTNCLQKSERFPVERFSKLHTLKRVVAWIIRFKTNCLQKSEESYSKCLSVLANENQFRINKGPRSTRHKKGHNNITCPTGKTNRQIHNAFKKLVKLSQAEYFEKEIKLLERGAHVAPILDADSLLRVGGRLENSLLTSDAKHPLLIHHKHRLATVCSELEDV